MQESHIFLSLSLLLLRPRNRAQVFSLPWKLCANIRFIGLVFPWDSFQAGNFHASFFLHSLAAAERVFFLETFLSRGEEKRPGKIPLSLDALCSLSLTPSFVHVRPNSKHTTVFFMKICCVLSRDQFLTLDATKLSTDLSTIITLSSSTIIGLCFGLLQKGERSLYILRTGVRACNCPFWKTNPLLSPALRVNLSLMTSNLHVEEPPQIHLKMKASLQNETYLYQWILCAFCHTC